MKSDGFSILMRAMQGKNDKLVTKSAFMLRNMLVLNPSHKCKYQFIETILGYCTIKHGRIYVAFVSALNAVSYKSLILIYMKINLQMKHSFITRVIHAKTCFDTGKDNSEMAYGNG